MLKIIKKYKYLITIIIILMIICYFYIRSNSLKENNIKYSLENENIILNTEEESDEEVEMVNMIKVDIKGQIVNPGVYELKENSRVIDVINIAGGLTDDANTSLINLAKKIEDGMVIIIYSNEEVANSNVKEVETVFKIIEKECDCPNIKNDSCINTELDNEQAEEDTKLININTASIEELMTLPSIGESKAKSIIEYRENTKFTSIEEIKNVSGIGEALFEKIKAHITI